MRQTIIEKQSNVKNINEIAFEIIGAVINVHRVLGLGLKPSTYKACLMHEFDDIGLHYEENVVFPLFYKNHFINDGVCVSLLVENRIIVDIQSTSFIKEFHTMNVLNQLCHADLKLGLIFNFNTKFMKGDAIRRVINGAIEM